MDKRATRMRDHPARELPRDQSVWQRCLSRDKDVGVLAGERIWESVFGGGGIVDG